MECAQCGTANRLDARFCKGCGATLARRCTQCNAQLEVDQRFCDECGTPVGGGAAPAAEPVASAVRKTVTVLFADLAGSTGFGERNDPEVARLVLARYHALLQAAIDAHGGTVAKFMGDGMMATFGIPEIAEDDAERAVRAGIDLQERFAEFAHDIARRHRETLTLRVGVNTGEIVIGERDADLVGDALNVAARLEHACAPGHVLVGEETWRVTRGRIRYRPLGEVSVAGRAQPVGTYEVDTTEQLAPEVAAPFVGRSDELARLAAVLDRAISTRSAALATVVGAPGLGKTRLSREFAATACAKGAVAFEIRCDRAGGQTFAPVVELIRAAVGDDLEAISLEVTDRDRVVDVLAGVVGTASPRSVEETFWGVRRLVEVLATEQPLVLVVDDIQWAEPKLLDLLEHLVEWVRDAPAVIVALARPEIRDVRGALAETGRRVADVIALDGLDSGATEALAAGLLGNTLPSELVSRLPQSTDGNPLFVRELVRMLVDDRIIERRDDGHWVLAVDAEAVEVPPSIQSLLSARVERLPGDELRTLELASVVGAEFSVGALRALGAGGGDNTVTAVLDRLRRRELVEPTGNYWGDEPVHRFHHVLIRDAVYRRLLKGTRATLHEQVGEWLAAQVDRTPGDDELTVAFHYEQSHRYRGELGMFDADTDALGRSAAGILRAAAQRALDADDLASGGALARRALAVLPPADDVDRLELLRLGCECLISAGDATAGAPLVEEFAARAGNDFGQAAWAVCFQSQLTGFTDAGGLIDAEAAVRDAATTLHDLGDGAGEAKAHQVCAGLLARLGRVGEAEGVLDQALAAARAAEDRRRVTAVLGAAPQAALFGPSPVARAGGRCLDVVRLLRITAASPSVEATSMRCQAVLEALRGRFDVARSMLAAARATVEELGLRHGLLETDLFSGMVELLAGDAAAAVPPLQAAYDGLGTLGVDADAGQAAALLAHAHLALGDVDAADRHAAAGEALAGQNLKTAIAWRIARARVLAARGDVAAGVALAELAVEMAAGTDLTLDHADACAALAALRMQAGDAEGARVARAEAQRLYDAKGATTPAALLRTGLPVPQRSAGPSGPPVGTPEGLVFDTLAARSTVRRVEVANHGGRDEVVALHVPGYRSFGRSGIGAGEMHAGQLGGTFDTSRELYSRFDDEILAVRGQHLVLGRWALGRGSFADPLLHVSEVDAAGRFVREDAFDESDLLAALELLDARHAELRGDEVSGIERAMATMTRAVNTRDWDAYTACIPPGFEARDHAVLGYPPMERDDFVGQLRVQVDEQMPDLVVYNASFEVEVEGDVALVDQGQVGTTVDGAPYTRRLWCVARLGRDGRIYSMDWFSHSQHDDARACFEGRGQWGAPRRSPADEMLDTPAARSLQRFVELAQRRAPNDELLGFFAPTFRAIDRRTTTLGPRESADLEGHGEFLAQSSAIYDHFSTAPIAVRGDHLTLDRFAVGRDGFLDTALFVSEFDDAGRMVHWDVFDERDLQAALDLLEARYEALQGDDYSPLERAIMVSARLVREGGWDAWKASLAPGFESHDWKPLGAGDQSDDGTATLVDDLYERVPDLVIVDAARRVSDDAHLSLMRFVGTTAEGADYSPTQWAVFHYDPELRLRRVDIFAEEQYDDARACFEGTGTWAPASPPPHEAVLDTLAARTVRRADDAEVLAVRGEHLVLARHEAERDESLQLTEVDDDGRVLRTELFANSELVDAYERLEARHAERLGDAYSPVERALTTNSIASNRHDWDAWTASLAPGFTSRDWRILGSGEIGRAEVLGLLDAGVEVMPDLVYLHAFTRVDGDACLALVVGYGTSPEGAGYRDTFWFVARFDSDVRVQRIDMFELDQYDAALACFERPSSGAPVDVENATARLVRRVFEVSALDADAGVALFAEGWMRFDRRLTVRYPEWTREEFAEQWRQARALGWTEWELTALAVRGERLALIRVDSHTPAGDHMVYLNLAESDGAGQLVSWTYFAEDDFDAALDDLDERWIAGKRAQHAHAIRMCGDLRRSMNRHDAAALGGLLDEAFTIVDHRPMSLGGLARDGYLDFFRASIEVMPDWRVVPARLEFAGDAVLMRSVVTGTGGLAERRRWDLWHVAASVAGRFTSYDFFAIEDETAARARFAELAAEQRTPEPDNAVVRLWRRGEWRMEFDDTYDPAESNSPELVVTDRRSFASLPPGMTREELAVASREQEAVFGPTSFEPLAVRGDHLALFRSRTISPSGFEMVALAVFEIDDAEHFSAMTFFDDDDLVAALDALNARYFDLCRDASRLERQLLTISQAMNRRDPGLGSGFASDAVGVDHQPLSFAPTDAAGLTSMSRRFIEFAPDVVVTVQKTYSSDRAVIAPYRATGHAPGGGSVEWSTILVERAGSDGLVDRLEFFAHDDWPEALRRFDEWSAGPDESTGLRLENLATRNTARFVEYGNAGRLAEFRTDWLARDYVHVDHRFAGIGDGGSAEWLATGQHYGDVGVTSVSMRPIAIRGERLAVNRIDMTSAAGDTIPVLCVVATDADGRSERTEVFDESELDAALDRLDDWYCEGEGREHALIVCFCRDSEDAIRRGDMAGFQALFTPDVVVRNHQPLSYAADTVEAIVDFGATLKGLAQRRTIVRARMECRGNAALAWYDDSVTDASGGERVTRIVTAIHLSRGREDVSDFFALEQLGEARARFDELAREPSHAPPDNLIVGKLARLTWLRRYERAARLSKAVEELWTDDAVLVDQRRGTPSEPIHGRKALLESVRATLQVFDDIREEPVAVRGARLALMQLTWVSDGFESSMYALHEADADGRVVETIFYDESDLSAALAELDRRNFVGLDADARAVLLTLGAFWESFWHLDTDAHRALLAPDFRFVDHTRLGVPPGGAEPYLANLASMWEQPTTGGIFRTLDVVGSVVIGLGELRLASPQGTEFSNAQWTVVQCTPDGQVRRVERFPEDQIAAAYARAHELADLDEAPAHSAAPVIENTASRVWADVIAACYVGDAGDTAALQRLVAPEFRSDDRVPVVNMGVQDLVGNARLLSAVRQQGFAMPEPLTLAIRGERFALCRNDARTATFDGSPRLCVAEVDEEDRLIAVTIFGEADAEAARAELERRYYSSLNPQQLAVLGAVGAFMAAMERLDLELIRASLAPDFAMDDHTPIGFGSGDADYYLEITELMREQRMTGGVHHSLEIVGSVLFARNEVEIASPQGGAFSRAQCAIVHCAPNGRIRRLEWYPDDQYDIARARAHELAALDDSADRAGGPPVENSATRLVARLLDLLNRGDWDGAGAVDGVAEQVVRIDRRRTVSAPDLGDAPGFAENAAAIYDVFGVVDPKAVACRGDRLALIRLHCGRPPQFTMRLLCLYELDAEGRIVREADFDDEDLAAAEAELDRWYLEGEGAEHAELLRAHVAGVRAFQTQDFDAMRTQLAPDLVWVDHRELSWGTLDLDAVLAQQQSYADVRQAYLTRTLQIDGRAVLAAMQVDAVTPDGTHAFWAFHSVELFDADLRCRCMEIFADDDWAAALTRFHYLA